MLHNLIFCNFFCFCNKKLDYVEIIRLLCSTRTKLSTAGPGRFNHIALHQRPIFRCFFSSLCQGLQPCKVLLTFTQPNLTLKKGMQKKLEKLWIERKLMFQNLKNQLDASQSLPLFSNLSVYAFLPVPQFSNPSVYYSLFV